MGRRRVLIMGAAGRDFHDFNVLFRDDPAADVVAFTAAQIPAIDSRRYPAELAGPRYPEGIPIFPEADLEALIRTLQVDEVIFAYSDVSFDYVMARAARVAAAGADFRLVSPRRTMLASRVPVVAVVAVRTGCGKSPTSRLVCRRLRERGLRVAAVRHPMPYGDLARQRLQRFADLSDLERAGCTIEEMEEYEPHILAGTTVFAGADYAEVLRAAEREADAIVWDGGNNDTSFFRPDLTITVVDPHRPGDELASYPGATNLLLADVVVIAKVDTAPPEQVRLVRASVAHANPRATVVEAAMPVALSDPQAMRGRRALVIEDGPTLTHGGMAFGAGTIAARQHGALIVDPRPYAVGAIAAAFQAHPQIGPLLPAMGYSLEQLRDLEETIRRTPCEVVVVGTPIDLRRVIRIDRPTVRATYELEERGGVSLDDVLAPVAALVARPDA
jgi:predicted GTPase